MATSNKPADVNTKAITSEDEEWMDGASATFAKAEHLAPSLPPNFGDGRLVAIWAQENGTRKSTNPGGKDYPFVSTVTLVLDEGTNGQDWLTGANGWDAEASTVIPAAPVRLDDFQHSTGGLVARLSKRVTGVNVKTGTPLKYRPMIGRMNTRASAQNKNVPAFSISEPTAADMVIARKYADMIKGINAELEAKDKKTEDQAAFE